jgi:hypothetical protein
MASRQPPPSKDPLEMARLELARLKDATDWDEPTGRTEVHVHIPQPSQPEIEAPKSDSIPAPAKGLRYVLGGVSSWMQVAALAILVAGLIAAYWLKGR